MGHNGSGPPDKWAAFSTAGMTGPDDLAQALSNLWAQGFTGPVVSVASPNGITEWWVAVAGYEKKP